MSQSVLFRNPFKHEETFEEQDRKYVIKEQRCGIMGRMVRVFDLESSMLSEYRRKIAELEDKLNKQEARIRELEK